MAQKVMFLVPSEEEIKIVRKRIGTTEDDIRQAVSSLRSWLEAQPHLPHVMDDGRLERMYVSCKCSIEKTKKTLDAYYTLKNKFPEMLMNRDSTSPELREIKKQMIIMTAPRMAEDCSRVGCILNICPDDATVNVSQIYKGLLMAADFNISFDYSVGYIFVIDLKNITAAHVTKISVRDVWTVESICRKAYSKRLVALHLTNAPKIVDMILSIIYLGLPEKFRNRVYTHLPGSETLFKYVSRSCIPNELGGTAGPAEELMDAALNTFASLRDWYLEEDKYVADESKRPPNNIYRHDYDLFGIDGSFKKLQVD